MFLHILDLTVNVHIFGGSLRIKYFIQSLHSLAIASLSEIANRIPSQDLPRNSQPLKKYSQENTSAQTKLKFICVYMQVKCIISSLSCGIKWNYILYSVCHHFKSHYRSVIIF